jgi:hypothetical protein
MEPSSYFCAIWVGEVPSGATYGEGVTTTPDNYALLKPSASGLDPNDTGVT